MFFVAKVGVVLLLSDLSKHEASTFHSILEIFSLILRILLRDMSPKEESNL